MINHSLINIFPINELKIIHKSILHYILIKQVGVYSLPICWLVWSKGSDNIQDKKIYFIRL